MSLWNKTEAYIFQPKNDRDICSSYFLTLCRYTMENPFLSGLLSTPLGNDLFEKMLKIFHHGKNVMNRFILNCRDQ